MPVERRGQAIRVMINLVNWQQEEPTGCGGGRQLSMDGTSRVTGDSHARFCERLGVRFPGPTRRYRATDIPTATRVSADSATTARRSPGFTSRNDGDDRMSEDDEDVVHAGIVSKSQKSRNSGRFCNSPPTRIRFLKGCSRRAAWRWAISITTVGWM